MSPYDKEKVDIANRLYKALLDANGISINTIRDQAMQELGVQISTKKLYQELLEYCNPENFMEPYDFEAVQKANDYYSWVEVYKNNIGELEKLGIEIMQDIVLRNYYQKEEETKERQRKKEEAEDNRNALIGIGIVTIMVMIIVIIVKACQ